MYIRASVHPSITLVKVIYENVYNPVYETVDCCYVLHKYKHILQIVFQNYIRDSHNSFYFVGFANDIGDEEMRDENVVVNMETDQPGSLQERPLPSKFALSVMCK